MNSHTSVGPPSSGVSVTGSVQMELFRRNIVRPMSSSYSRTADKARNAQCTEVTRKYHYEWLDPNIFSAYTLSE